MKQHPRGKRVKTQERNWQVTSPRLKPSISNEPFMKKSSLTSILLAISAALLSSLSAWSQVEDRPDGANAGIPVNYTEARVGAYTLPDPLRLASGLPVKDAKAWTELRRLELLKYYQSERRMGRHRRLGLGHQPRH